MSILEMVGITGFIGYISAYSLLQMGLLSIERLPYTLLNLLSASLVLISLTEAFNLASAMIQFSWIVISLFGIAKLLRERKKYRPIGSCHLHQKNGSV